MFCGKCGNKLREGDLFCNKCGNKVSNNFQKDNAERKKVDKNIIIFVIAFIILIVVIGMSLISIYGKGDIDIFNSISSSIGGNKNTDMEYEKMKEYLNEVNNKNTNTYQQYLADLQKINYINYKAIDPPQTSSIDTFQIEFIEEYNNYYIYKFKTQQGVQLFSYLRLAHTASQTYSYTKPPASVRTYIERNKDYYFAKSKDSNEYVKFENDEIIYIFNDTACTESLELLKSNL